MEGEDGRKEMMEDRKRLEKENMTGWRGREEERDGRKGEEKGEKVKGKGG